MYIYIYRYVSGASFLSIGICTDDASKHLATALFQLDKLAIIGKLGAVSRCGREELTTSSGLNDLPGPLLPAEPDLLFGMYVLVSTTGDRAGSGMPGARLLSLRARVKRS